MRKIQKTAASASTAGGATAPVAPDAPEERSDLLPGVGDGEQGVEELVGGTEILEEVVVVAELDVN